MMLCRHAKILNTKHQIQNTLVKRILSDFLRDERVCERRYNIMAETEKEEAALLAKSEEYKTLIEDRVYAYTRIRKNVKNGLAVVPIERGASGGSFFTIPPQIQMEIASRKKIITDEHSGRILVDEALAIEQKEKMDKLFASL